MSETYSAMVSDQAGAWLASLQPASWRGLGFAVDTDRVLRGRQTALHVYPFRDLPWNEDLGQAPRIGTFSAFVVGDDCYAQAQALLAASEIPGPGELVHPSLGSLTVSLTAPMEATTRKDLGRVVEIRFEYVETGLSIYPSASVSTASTAVSNAALADTACTADFLSTVGAAVAEGAAVITSAVATVVAWTAVVAAAAGDASLIVGAVAGLAGNFGRYGLGYRTVGQTAAVTVAGAIATLTAARAAVGQDGAAAATLAGALSATTVTATTSTASVAVDDGLYAAFVALTEALRAECSDPGDAVRLLSSLAGYTPSSAPSTAPIGAAIATVTTALGQAFRRASLSSLARACASYQPSSYDDAIALRNAVVLLFDAEIIIAADAEQDASYQALRTLRASVSDDLTTRGTDLARLAAISTAAPMPSLTLAYRLYRDATRSDDLIARADPVAPLWMPVSFEALSS